MLLGTEQKDPRDIDKTDPEKLKTKLLISQEITALTDEEILNLTLMRDDITKKMHLKGYCNDSSVKYIDSSSHEAKEYFRQTIACVVSVLYGSKDARQSYAKLTKEAAVNLAWEFVDGKNLIHTSRYLRGLKKEHLARLFDLYAMPPKNEIDVEHFCLAFLYLRRPNSKINAAESSLADTIDAIYPAVLASQESKMEVFSMSRVESEKQLKAAAEKNKQWMLCYSEGRVEVKSGGTNTYGLNIEIRYLDSKNNFQCIPYVCINFPAKSMLVKAEKVEVVDESEDEETSIVPAGEAGKVGVGDESENEAVTTETPPTRHVETVDLDEGSESDDEEVIKIDTRIDFVHMIKIVEALQAMQWVPIHFTPSRQISSESGKDLFVNVGGTAYLLQLEYDFSTYDQSKRKTGSYSEEFFAALTEPKIIKNPMFVAEYQSSLETETNKNPQGSEKLPAIHQHPANMSLTKGIVDFTKLKIKTEDLSDEGAPLTPKPG